MALEVGSRLGHYDVTALIGEGGMGQVYRATDTKLKREVALKILPEAFSADPERLARFQREAEVLASLNHPNIAAIHGLEESDGVRALVLELVEGPTLADRIKQGPIPLDEALPIAKQIAEALEAAHEAGVIHRDLKPANIKVRDDGTVKVLDFGLAKALDPSPDGDPSESPTLTAMATQMGVILGTAAYMSPEQARGKKVDKRTDVWAFGAVLFEMLTGKHAFEGEDVSMTLSSVLQREPDWSRLPSAVSPSLSMFLHRCLEKDPKQRVHDVADVRLALEGAFEDASEETVDAGPATAVVEHQALRKGAMLAAVVLVAVSIAAVSVWVATRPVAPSLPGLVRFTVDTGDVGLAFSPGSLVFAVSPDGRDMIILGIGREDASRTFPLLASRRRLFRRSLGSLSLEPLRGTRSAVTPFFSPDGAWVGFWSLANGLLMKVPLDGGAPVTIAEVPAATVEATIAGASWSADDTIIFGGDGTGAGLRRVDAQGGEPEVLVVPDPSAGEIEFGWPQVLPQGEAVIYSVAISTDDDSVVGRVAGQAVENRVEAYVLASGERRILIENASHPRYAPSGHLLFSRRRSNDAASGTTVMAVPFDVSSLEVRGEARPVVENLLSGPTGGTQFVVSETGTALAVPEAVAVGGTPPGIPVWMTRDGREEPLDLGPLIHPTHPQISPDGRQLALVTGEEADGDVWVYDLVRSRPPVRATFDGAQYSPIWSLDGSALYYEQENGSIFTSPADGSALEGRSVLLGGHYHPLAWTPDGGELVIVDLSGAGNDLLSFAVGDDEPRVLVATEYSEGRSGATFDRDGRWLAYASDVTGQMEIWVKPYLGEGTPVRISSNGGDHPVWSRDGREIYYLEDGTRMMAVPVQAEEEFRFDRSEFLFEANVRRVGRAGQAPLFDVAPDGRFLFIRPESGDSGETGLPTEFEVVLNWFTVLTDRVPTGQ